ncbi:universal stress protein [Nocardioides sp. SYSU D00038]|uniref:universal stress protein n=1 Tax=Nocardioides sp. SYSU D00038 TaxID=2812554 RepID=UPI00196708C9|nr:universal stress protein [Nocardioides sp. SYSU D00038]
MSVVVVGVDGSTTAARAAETAAGLATALGSELLVLVGFPSIDRPEPTDSETLTTREAAEQLADAVAEPLRAANPGLVIHADAEPGKPAEALVYAAESREASLIVIGNKRVQGVSRILGSVAVDVVRKASCDVYIAHTTG